MVEKVIRDGMVAVLVSRGYGAGWTTWCYDDNREKLMYDPTLVQMCEDSASLEDMAYYVSVAYPDQYKGGLDGLYVEWVHLGERFKIEENDGAEWVDVLDLRDWEIA